MSKRLSDIGPYSILPEWLIFAVSGNALKVWGLIARHANADSEAWPSIASIEERLELTENTVIRCIKELEAAGALQVHRNRRTGNRYTVNHGKPRTSKNEVLNLKKCGSEPQKLRKNENQEREPRTRENTTSSCKSDDGRAEALWEVFRTVQAFANGMHDAQVQGLGNVAAEYGWLSPKRMLREAEACCDKLRVDAKFGGANTTRSDSAAARFRNWLRVESDSGRLPAKPEPKPEVKPLEPSAGKPKAEPRQVTADPEELDRVRKEARRRLGLDTAEGVRDGPQAEVRTGLFVVRSGRLIELQDEFEAMTGEKVFKSMDEVSRALKTKVTA